MRNQNKGRASMRNKNDSRAGSALECTHCVIVPVYAMEKCQAQRKRKTGFTRGEGKDKMIQLENGRYN